MRLPRSLITVALDSGWVAARRGMRVGGARRRSGCHASITSAGPPHRRPRPRRPSCPGERAATIAGARGEDREHRQRARPRPGSRARTWSTSRRSSAGLTRLVAVFSSKYPRSRRPGPQRPHHRPAPLAQFGRPAFAYAGAQTTMLPVSAGGGAVRPGVRAAGRPAPYFRQRGRVRPLQPVRVASRQLLTRRPQGEQRPPDIGFTFSDEAPAEGESSARRTRSQWPAAVSTFAGPSGSPGEAMAGVGRTASSAMAAEGRQLGAPHGRRPATSRPTASELRRQVRQSYTPLVETVGQGTALVFRDGQMYKARWERASAGRGYPLRRTAGTSHDLSPQVRSGSHCSTSRTRCPTDLG